jgi:hypothetical protein
VRRLLATAVLAAGLSLGAQAAQAASPAPTLSPDLGFARSSTGIFARDSLVPAEVSGTAADPASDRILSVGTADGPGGAHDILVTSRHADGSPDGTFGSDGAETVPLTPGADATGVAVAVLPDHRVLVLGTVVDTGGLVNVVLARLNPSGSPDGAFGDQGVETFPVGSGDDAHPTRMAVNPDGRIAITGWTAPGGAPADDPDANTFVAVRDADGSPGDFGGSAGWVVLDEAPARPDRGAGIAWRPGGDGPVALIDTSTEPDGIHAVALHAFHGDGGGDPGFGAGTADVSFGTAGLDTVPSGLIAYGGRLWMTATITVDQFDSDGLLARVAGDGTGLERRRFDLPGSNDQRPDTRLGDLVVVPGDPDTLVVGGSMLGSAGGRRAWAAGAFNDLGGPLAAMPAGKLLLPPDPSYTTDSGIVSLAAAGTETVAAAGHLSSGGSPAFGAARMLVDAEKRCDLSVAIAGPLEVVFSGLGDAGIQVRVANHGSRGCGGTLGTAAPYSLSGPLAVGPLAPGASQLLDLRVAHAGAKPSTGQLVVDLDAPADGATGDNLATVPTRFSFCDAVLRRIGPSGAIAAGTTRRFEFTVRNAGTATCTGVHLVALAGSRRIDRVVPYSIRPGLSVTDDMLVAIAKAPKAGTRKPLGFGVVASGDVNPADDIVGASPKSIRMAHARTGAPRAKGTRYSGRAFAGSGRKVAKSLLKVRRVDVAIQKLGGKGCHWIGSVTGRTTKVKPGRKRACDTPVWITATGTSAWSLTLQRKLAKGRYRLLARAVTSDELTENTFTRKGRNRIDFRVR